MLTATEISEALAGALAEGRSMAIVSVLTREGHPLPETPRLLVMEETGARLGTLGDAVLDETAAAYSAFLIREEQRAVVVAGPGDLHDVPRGGNADALRNLAIPGDLRLLFEISRPRSELVICGGGHVGQAVARAGRLLDFKVILIDDRAEFASRDKFPDPAVRLIADDFVAALASLKITRASHLVIVTRGHRHDELCLKHVIGSPARYIGMIGSRRRTTTIREHLRREGVSAEYLRRVYAPIGLDIGALTPEEIALAILSEIVLVRRGGSGAPKSAEGPMARTR